MLDLNLRVHSDLQLPSDIVTHKHFISRMRADADVTTGEIFDFVINMDKAVAFDPQSEMRIK